MQKSMTSTLPYFHTYYNKMHFNFTDLGRETKRIQIIYQKALALRAIVISYMMVIIVLECL